MFILADPVDHIVGSDVLNKEFETRGLNVAVSPLCVEPGDLADAFGMIRRLKNVVGFGVTVPHKIAAVRLVDRLTSSARDVGAVNFVRRSADGSLAGHNIDGEGFLAGLSDHGVVPMRADVLQSGAGGVGRAIAFSLARAGARSIHIVNRSRERAEHLKAALAQKFPLTAVDVAEGAGDLHRRSYDLVVNATSLGMHAEDPLPIPLLALAPATVVAEVIMQPAETRLLREARLLGCLTVPGIAMMKPQPRLVAQFLGLDGGES